MSFKVEELGKSMVKLTIEVAAEEFEKAMETAYQKNKNKLSVQGFRKGKAPRAMIEKIENIKKVMPVIGITPPKSVIISFSSP